MPLPNPFIWLNTPPPIAIVNSKVGSSLGVHVCVERTILSHAEVPVAVAVLPDILTLTAVEESQVISSSVYGTAGVLQYLLPVSFSTRMELSCTLVGLAVEVVLYAKLLYVPDMVTKSLNVKAVPDTTQSASAFGSMSLELVLAEDTLVIPTFVNAIISFASIDTSELNVNVMLKVVFPVPVGKVDAVDSATWSFDPYPLRIT